MTLFTAVAQALVDANKAGIPKVTADQSTLTGIINALLGLLGIVAIIFIIVGAISYITSNGDAGATSKAKNTILFAIIGLVIAALAYGIVNFVLGKF
ncbi:MAG TPA: hypothetical protein VFL81_01905 [Candidatus Saccharimonadales bacterium]|nr:hypothetical protein [Candidatus Saccharimonadales bacterium]